MQPSRRQLLVQALGAGALGLGLPVCGGQGAPAASELVLTLVSGTPRERGRQYGRRFESSIRAFLEHEIWRGYAGRPNPREALLRHAGACGRAIREYAPEIHEELEGMAEGSGLALEELVLVTCHEELWHGGLVPASDHCTVFGAAPPDTAEGATFVGQTWDWMESVYGLSSMLLWRRSEGPSVLAYSYPGLWTGAGLNSAGVALCWHTGSGGGNEPRVGIPAYVLIAQMLYQDTLAGALAEARRARHAGWFVFLLCDGQGRLVTVRGNPRGLEVLEGALANGGRLRASGSAPVDLAGLQENCRRVQVPTTLDAMVFDCTRKEAHVTRRAGGVTPWTRFGFDG